MDVRFPPSLLKRRGSNLLIPDPNVSLRPAIIRIDYNYCATDINPDSVGGSTLHLNATPGFNLEHVNRTASPEHTTLVLDNKEANSV